ncbi:hypothetical protein [Sulfurimonas sp. CS5]|uniref:hypothetical protein n=1 Tax=Sulfurimonas sp. CS5 TaxID=3391145 RepID=UPI0039E7F078
MKTEYLKIFFIIWFILLFLNQAFIYGCFAPYCILAGVPHTGIIAFFITLYLTKTTPITDTNKQIFTNTEDDSVKNATQGVSTKVEDELSPETIMAKAKREVARKKAEETKKANQDERTSKQYEQSSDSLKQWGDKYEKFIGKQFEKKDELVIYNSFIRGYEDDGVDIIAISTQTKTIHLIQCKNWTKKPLLLNDVQNIYKKLQNFNLARITQSSTAIKEHLEIDKSIESIKDIQRVNKSDYSIRKTLYVGSDKIVDLNIGKHLKLITPTIFRYEDMKIVIKSLS